MPHLPTRPLAILLLGAFAMPPAMARDVATEQYNVSAAREHYNAVRAEYEAATQQAAVQAKRVAQEKAHLDELRKQQQAAKARLDTARSKLKQREQALEHAWNSGS